MNIPARYCTGYLGDIGVRDGKMGEIPADPYLLIERFPGRSGGAGMLVAERDVVVHEIADGLDPAPAHGRVSEQAPRRLGQFLGVAVAAPQQEYQRLLWQFLDRMLVRDRRDDVGLPAIPDQGGAGDPQPPGRGDETGAPVAEAIAIGRQREPG